MTRTHGCAPKGQRQHRPYSYWKTTTFVTGPTLRGMIAPFVLDGPINRLAFGSSSIHPVRTSLGASICAAVRKPSIVAARCGMAVLLLVAVA